MYTCYCLCLFFNENETHAKKLLRVTIRMLFNSSIVKMSWTIWGGISQTVLSAKERSRRNPLSFSPLKFSLTPWYTTLFELNEYRYLFYELMHDNTKPRPTSDNVNQTLIKPLESLSCVGITIHGFSLAEILQRCSLHFWLLC